MSRLLPSVLAILVCLCVAQVHAGDLDRAALQSALDIALDNDPTARRITVALKVMDVKSGEVLYDRYGDRLFTPASNLKIYTSACALDLFGPKHCFPTRLIAKVDKQANAIVGDLTLVGGGNAMLSSSELRMLADRVVKEWGVSSLHGKVVVDNSRYSHARLGPGWMWDDQPYYFNMQVTPLMVDFNVRTIPGKSDTDGDPRRVAMQEPAFWIALDFEKMLRERGVDILDKSSENTATAVRQVISYPGLSLAAAVKHFNHVSENAVGEVLLHEIAIAKGKRSPTWSDGAKEITDWLHETAGLETGSFRLVDGSGLSRYNLISADSSLKLLSFMHKHRHFRVFFDSLPAYGVIMSKGVREIRVRAKPGGMSGVSTVSGYLETLEGRQLVFSLLGNGFIGSSKPMRDLRGKVWAVLVRFAKDK